MDEKKLWDEAAGDYQRVFSLGLSGYSAALLRFWQDEGMIWPGCRVLDVGCGVGKYGCYLAELGCDVTLTDISEEMLRHAAANMAKYRTPWAIHACDFNAVTGEEPVFSQGFDLVISTMSPAVHDERTVRKMSALSRGCCFLSRFQSWEQPTRDALLRRMGTAPRRMVEAPEEDVAAMVRAVGAAGFRPRVKTVPYRWSDGRSPEEMADFLCRRCLEAEPGDTALYDRALRASRALADEKGRVADAVNTTVAWIYWRPAE